MTKQKLKWVMLSYAWGKNSEYQEHVLRLYIAMVRRRVPVLGLLQPRAPGAGRIVAFGDSQMLDERHRPPPPRRLPALRSSPMIFPRPVRISGK